MDVNGIGPLLKSCLALLLFYTTMATAESFPDSISYHLDNKNECHRFGSQKFFTSYQEAGIIQSWSTTNVRNPIGSSCYITFFADSLYGLRYKFASGSNYIRSGEATLNIYKSSTPYGTKLATYTSYDYLPTYYQTTDSWRLTVEFQNYKNSTNFDFQLIVTNYDVAGLLKTTTTTRSPGYNIGIGTTIGLSVSGVGLVTVLVSMIYLYIRRRGTATGIPRGIPAGATSNYNYPTVALYQPGYGNTAATTTGNYPPPSYPGPPPAPPSASDLTSSPK